MTPPGQRGFAPADTVAPGQASRHRSPRAACGRVGGPLAVAVLLLLGCSGGPPTAPNTVTPAGRGGIALIGPACPGVRSCLMGQVVAAESATPLARATIFLEREDTPDAATEQDMEADVRINRITDDDGVFTVVDAPAGHYRLAVYKEERHYKVRGLLLGQPGTTMLPVRLPKV